MAVRFGINGFGRIGRQSLKALIERAPDVEVVAVNDLVDTELNAFLFKHDSAMAPIPARWTTPENALIIDGREIKVLKERDPAVLPWGDLGVDIVLESTQAAPWRRARELGRLSADLDSGHDDRRAARGGLALAGPDGLRLASQHHNLLSSSKSEAQHLVV